MARGEEKGVSTNSHEVQEIAGDSWSISLPKTRISTLNELLVQYKIDLEEWEVERFVINKWEVGRTGEGGDVEVEPLFQVKAFLKRRVLQVGIREEIAALREQAKSKAHKPAVIKRARHGPSGNLLELSIPDLHIGKLAWSGETGWDNYDVRIAERIFDQALQSLVERTGAYRADEVVFVVGNDLLHTDNAQNTTTAGTPVTTDSRYHKTFKTAREMIVRAVEALRVIAPVRVVVVPGNHDTLSAWHLGDSLECYFHRYTDVAIENAPTPRKYMRWGNVMLMWTHGGTKTKLADHPLLMATEQPEMFGATRYREIHTGHLHQVRLEEKHGVRVRILPSLSAADDWHSENGFVGGIRAAEAYVWSKEEGLIGTAVFTTPDKVKED